MVDQFKHTLPDGFCVVVTIDTDNPEGGLRLSVADDNQKCEVTWDKAHNITRVIELSESRLDHIIS